MTTAKKTITRLFEIAAGLGVEIVTFDTRRAKAFVMKDTDGITIVYNPKKIHNENELAFIIAHELAHVLRGKFYNILETPVKEIKAEEKIVNELAKSILLSIAPEFSFAPPCMRNRK